MLRNRVKLPTRKLTAFCIKLFNSRRAYVEQFRRAAASLPGACAYHLPVQEEGAAGVSCYGSLTCFLVRHRKDALIEGAMPTARILFSTRKSSFYWFQVQRNSLSEVAVIFRTSLVRRRVVPEEHDRIRPYRSVRRFVLWSTAHNKLSAVIQNAGVTKPVFAVDGEGSSAVGAVWRERCRLQPLDLHNRCRQ